MSGSARASRPPDREATEAALQRAALTLLERNGALAGLNLREVADEAGVNRGLVYHYFGSRQDLLRAALRSDVRQRMSELDPGEWSPLPERWGGFLPSMLRQRQAVILAALLIMDGDAKVRMIPYHDRVRRRHQQDVDEGWLHEDLDLDSVHVALSSTVYGYLIFRERMAAELHYEVEDLDREMGRVFRRMLAGLVPEFGVEDGPEGNGGEVPDGPRGGADGADGAAGAPASAGG